MLHIKKTGIELSALALAVVVLSGSLTACAGKRADPMAPFRNNGLELSLENADPDHFPGYLHYDPTEFYKNCDKLLQYGTAESRTGYKKAWELYDKLYKDAVLCVDYTYTVNAGINENVNNEYFLSESEYINKISTEMKDRLKAVCSEICSGAASEEFKAHLGDERLFNYYSSYKTISGKEKELLDEETKLLNQYKLVYDEIDKASYEENFDYPEANKKAGDIFVALVKVRKEIAKLNGYDSYADYCDKEVHQRDYNSEDLVPLKEAAKKYGKLITYFTFDCFVDYADEELSSETIIEDVDYAVSKISERAYDSVQLLKNSHLLSAGYEDFRANSEITTNLSSTGSAVIQMKFYKDAALYNYGAYSHELGHFSAMTLLPNSKYPLFTENGCLDVIELHSNFLQMLTAMRSDCILSDSDYYKAFTLASYCGYIQSGCIYDEWQRRIYNSEQELTLEDINKLYKEICLEYGTYDYDNLEYDWIWVNHNFESPMYYISYGTTAFATLQLWQIADEDFDAAVDIWENILFESSYEKGFFDALYNVGLYSFVDSDFNEELLDHVLGYIQDLEIGIYGNTLNPYADQIGG